jgi:prolipoprotein diacylglyceryltransferase
VPDDLAFSFDPVLRLSETASVRYETIGLAIVIFVALLLLAWRSSRTPGLRIDDLVFILVGTVPGAIFGGRLGYVLDHLAFYRANPDAILDPAQGGLSLTLAVPFGILTGAAIAHLLGAPTGRWAHAAALPLLFVLAAGKLVGVLGGSGQGLPADVPWATAYLGPGPWGSLAADIPSHPAQVYEAVAVGVAIVVLGVLARARVLRGAGTPLFAALGLWAVARIAASTTWRDPIVVGPFHVEQLLLAGVLIVAATGFLIRARAPQPTGDLTGRDVEVQPA